MTEGDPAEALIAAVRRNDALTIQRITRRPDLAQIAVALAQHVVTPPLRSCGTRSAAERHIANGEPLDAACLRARRRYYRDVKRAQRLGPTPARPASSPTASSPDVDSVVVERLIAGQPPLHVRKAERTEAVRVLHDRGRATSEIAVQLHMSGTRVVQVLDGLVRAATDTPAEEVAAS